MNQPKKEIERYSTLTCPECGYQSRDLMPSDACQFFYDCPNCNAFLKPNAGDCCVYCSFGDVKCPPIQASSSCCT
ncbi:GDCCVxC domain-containing (seleno)protein [Dokdonella sp.]|uniref:GDCCVxC domain-containing (seleno)protein n=1 Tax=Dokdonella sp. TaxID=2291710 RepID=UPI0035273985